MRLFAALPVSGEARQELERKLAEYRREAWPVKWVRDGGLHVTIKFLGEVEEFAVADICAALRGAARRTMPLRFVPTEIGAFPSFTGARVLWAGYETESALELMVHRVEQEAAKLGFPGDGHPFRPHVTLGRVRQGGRLIAEAVQRLESERLASGFSTDRLVLYHSRLEAGGPTYDELDSFPLSE